MEILALVIERRLLERYLQMTMQSDIIPIQLNCFPYQDVNLIVYES